MAKIIGVQKRGLADKAGIKKGDELVAINHKPLIDILDLAYAEGQDRCVLTVMRDGKNIDFTIKKKYFDDEIGIDVGDSLEINCPINCHNNCVFCFVAQLPKGMRNTLYVKDDDYRLSFASGSYITCTNLKDSEIERIIEYKLSPLYISVHATDEETRLKLLGVKRSRNQLELIKKFADNGIKMHTQIVLVPEWNDGEILKKSLRDLRDIGENLMSVAVVPVGLTGHREGLTALRLNTKEEASR
ncbi:MAG: radical SAM protein, partial [Clostridia bacterium]|nr:radical SAM protein [Clostridia bacterium]